MVDTAVVVMEDMVMEAMLKCKSSKWLAKLLHHPVVVDGNNSPMVGNNPVAGNSNYRPCSKQIQYRVQMQNSATVKPPFVGVSHIFLHA